MKKFKIISLILIIIFLIIAVAYFFNKVQDDMDTSRKKDNDVLLIGTYVHAPNQDNMNITNAIHIQVYNEGVMVENLYHLTTDNDLVMLEEVPGLIFVDLTNIMLAYTMNLGIKTWQESNPINNYIDVQIEWLGAPFLSANIMINDSGVWGINVPTDNGIVPQIEHSHVYNQNDYFWQWDWKWW